MQQECAFCRPDWFRSAELVIQGDLCVYASSRDPADSPDVLPFAGAIVPIAHRSSPFHLSPEEWAETHELLLKARVALHERIAPDGYMLGWNDFPRRGQSGLHAHFHVIPRFDDEPLWDRGVKSAVKVEENVRPEPLHAGRGRALQR